MIFFEVFRNIIRQKYQIKREREKEWEIDRERESKGIFDIFLQCLCNILLQLLNKKTIFKVVVISSYRTLRCKFCCKYPQLL